MYLTRVEAHTKEGDIEGANRVIAEMTDQTPYGRLAGGHRFTMPLIRAHAAENDSDGAWRLARGDGSSTAAMLSLRLEPLFDLARRTEDPQMAIQLLTELKAAVGADASAYPSWSALDPQPQPTNHPLPALRPRAQPRSSAQEYK